MNLARSSLGPSFMTMACGLTLLACAPPAAVGSPTATSSLGAQPGGPAYGATLVSDLEWPRLMHDLQAAAFGLHEALRATW